MIFELNSEVVNHELKFNSFLLHSNIHILLLFYRALTHLSGLRAVCDACGRSGGTDKSKTSKPTFAIY